MMPSLAHAAAQQPAAAPPRQLALAATSHPYKWGALAGQNRATRRGSGSGVTRAETGGWHRSMQYAVSTVVDNTPSSPSQSGGFAELPVWMSS